MKKDRQLGLGKQGMNKDSHITSLTEGMYTYALNSNTQGQDGDSLNLQNEESNILCSNFPQDFKVIGKVRDLTADRTYFALVDPLTNRSQIGYIADLDTQISFEDKVESSCNCGVETVLAEGLENIQQKETCTYVSLIRDFVCEFGDPNFCLNFNINYPISMTLKDEKCGKVLYFVDDLNSDRRLEVQNLTKYFRRSIFCSSVETDLDYIEGCDCGTIEEDVCINCDRMAIMPKHRPLCIKVDGLVNGGQVRHGQYAFSVAYSDSQGNIITDYLATTSKVSVKDPNKNTYAQPELDAVTNFSIKVLLDGLDPSFDYFKVAVLQRSSVDGANAFFTLGVFPTSTKQVLFSGEQNLKRVSLEELIQQLPDYLRSKTVTQANNTLFRSDLEARPDPNLQPVVNFIGQFAKWRTVVADEDIYETARGTANYVGYMRDEIVPFGIRFLTDSGYKTPLYPLISRAETPEDTLFDGEVDLISQQATIDNADPLAISPSDGWIFDVKSVLDSGNGTCSSEVRNKKWQFYNTSPEDTEFVYQDCGATDAEKEPKEITKKCTTDDYIEIDLTTDIVLDNFQEGDKFTTLLQYIKDNDGNLPDDLDYLQDALDAARTSGSSGFLNCCDSVDLFSSGDGCVNIELVGDPQLSITNLLSTDTDSRIISTIVRYPCNSGLYSRISNPSTCDGVYTFAFDNDGNSIGKELNTSGDYDIWLADSVGCSPNIQRYFERTPNYLANNSSSSAFVTNPIPYDNITTTFNIIPLFPSVTNPTSEATLLSNIPTTAIVSAVAENQNAACYHPIFGPCLSGFSLYFAPKVHKNALWYKVTNIQTDYIMVNISKVTEPISDFKDCLTYSKELRLSAFDSTLQLISINSNPREAVKVPIKAFGTVSPSDGVYCIDTQGLDTVYFAIDAPIIKGGQDPLNVYLSGTQNCLALGVHEPLIEKVIVGLEDPLTSGIFNLGIRKTCVFTANCQVPVSSKLKCNPYPWEEGKFAYWESTIKYPNNDFLYNSFSQITNLAQLSFDHADNLAEFQNIFMQGGNLKQETTDFTCKEIRHFKFPDNERTNIIDLNTSIGQDNKVYPIGIFIDNDVINSMLNLAMNNGLIDETFRNSITHYEIFRGDTRLNKSIVAKGLTYDMFSYKEDGTSFSETTYFANFPYNDLSDNKLLYLDDREDKFVTHPDSVSGDFSNYRFLFQSPETSYEKPALPFEMYVESYMKGFSRGVFAEVESHPTMVVLTDKAFTLAKILATVEIVLDGITKISELIAFQAVGLSTNIGAIIGISLYGTSYFASSFAKGRLKVEEWTTIFSNLSKPTNFAYMYTSEGKYNSYFDGVRVAGNITRGLSERQYLSEGRYRFDERQVSNSTAATKPTVINHYNRESGVYLYTREVLGLPSGAQGGDTSRVVASDFGCYNGNVSPEYISQISSPYVSLKQYIPNQFGSINDIQWIFTGYCGKLSQTNTCDVIFGGDTFLSRFWFKRKFPFFVNNMIDGANTLPDLVPFNYKKQRNVGYPNYYISYLSAEEDSGKFLGIEMRAPFQSSDYNFDCLDTTNSRDKEALAVQEGSKFYLWYYGIPGFIVESRVNNNFRFGHNNREKDFYPNNSDYVRWTQEKNVSIREDNYYYYNNIYSSENDIYAYRVLPDNYNPDDWNCRFNHWDRTIYSLADNNEQDLLDNFRIFKANNFYDFGNKYGDFYGLEPIEQQKVIGRFENGLVIFNAYSTIQGSTENYAVGTGNIFQNRPSDFYQTELGYGGTQHRAWVSCEYGHFWVDAKRGKVFNVKSGGNGVQEISDNGLSNWFRENLPFRIKKQFPNIPNDMLDNTYDGLGITMVWDDRYSRLFITKRDVRVKKDKLTDVYISELDFKLVETGEIIHTNNTDYFEDCSWTIAYKPSNNPQIASWVSYYSFKPDYYVAHQNYFSSGLNYGDDKGIWNHLLGNNQSFQVFYGKLYPWIIEVPVKTNLQTKMYEDFSYRLDVRRYRNEYDYGYYEGNFNKGMFYNDREATGLLKFITQKPNDQRQKINYPKYVQDGVEVLVTKADYVWSTNFFFDNVKENHTQPIWFNAPNNADKDLNAVAFDYRPVFKNYIRGQYLLARLTQDNESRLKFIFEHFVMDSASYDGY